MIRLGAWRRHRQPIGRRLHEMGRWMDGRGFRLEVDEEAAGDYVFFVCRGGPDSLEAAWTPIVRSQLASAIAELMVGPMATRWLTRWLTVEARARRYSMGIGVRERALQMARQLVEAPPLEATVSVVPPPARAAAGVGPGSGVPGTSTLAGNLGRWQAHLSRCLLEALTAHPLVVVESVACFPAPSFVGALRRAAAAVVQELVAEREEHRAALPWRSLWMGPPPRAYEVHLFRSADGGYQLLDRWGEPAGRRWLGDAAREASSEETVVAHLVRLGPRRSVLHLSEEAPVQAAVRSAFPGRVHTCHGCPRCMLARRGQEVPGPSR
ncbi:MAG: hypothetical protein GX496_04905 [Firmicutes bacterium]|nr:hypothetical protein [Bacillota bacterium]